MADPGVSAEVAALLAFAPAQLGFDDAASADESSFARHLADGAYDVSVGARVRVVGTLDPATRERLAARPEVALLDDAVTASGRVELRYWLKEQAVSITLHRFGNPSSAFHALAEELKG
ncbi:hypothetical protein NBM05_01210 [Rothia sp. AR01]|uniref:Uncharacterized protein n=1 Tax=Rothia santali TaxID=2949643 RepID=A0A9X2H8J3_9MICC|nr:hypothetical protein [Rothia santali]MCP3424686.1 hypothetical protein [Rothia santali]